MNRRSLSRPARRLRALELGVQAVSALGNKSVFEQLFELMAGQHDFDYAVIDGTIMRVHQHGTGAKGD